MGITTKLAPYAGVKRVDENGRTVLSKLWNMGQPRFEGAMEFDGDHVNISNKPEYEIQSQTLSLWFYPQKRITGTSRRLFSKGRADEWQLYRNPNTTSNQISWLRYYNSTGGGTSFQIPRVRFEPNKFTHTTFVTHSDGSWKMLVNGQIENQGGTPSDFISWVNDSNSLRLGASDFTLTQVQIWNRALTQSEIQENMYKTLKGDENGLVAYYPLDEIVDINGTPSVLDKTENENHGTVNGNPKVVSPFNPVFGGNEQPELNKAEKGWQMSVEKKSENLGSPNITGYSRSGGSILTKVGNTKIGIYDAETFDLTIGTLTSYPLRESISNVTDHLVYVCYCYARNESNSRDLRIKSGYGRDEESTTILQPNEFGLFICKIRPSEEKPMIVDIRFEHALENEIHRFSITKIMTEQSEYPTLFTEGIRQLPKSNHNLLPPTGHLAISADLVRDTDTYGEQYIFDTAESDDLERSYLKLTEDNTWELQIYGKEGGVLEVDNPIDWDDYTRKDLVFIPSWDDDNLYLWICDSEGNLYQYSTQHQINESTIELEVAMEDGEDITTSNRYYKLESDDEVISTAERVKEKIERLTASNLGLKVEQIKLI